MMSVNTAITIPEPNFSHHFFFVEFPTSTLKSIPMFYFSKGSLLDGSLED